MNINRGSEWRKWDLHLHSYYTHLNNGYLEAHNTEDEYIQKIIDSGLSVVGLTNYFKFSNEDFALTKRLKDNNITVFLNLELRLSYQNKEDDLCDFHIIFDNKVSENDIKMFLDNLDVNVDAAKKKAFLLTKEDIDRKACVDFENTIENLNNEALNLKGKYLTGILARGKGNSRSASRYEALVKNTDLVIHSTDSVFNIERDKAFFDSIHKPLTQNSDAHSVDKIGTKFTWIKADPTFEGLKQILYEPESRVKIQETKPDEKLGYNIIDSIELNDESFWKQTIHFNPNLNTIIGGRSTGKSSLLKTLYKKIEGGSFSDEEERDSYLNNELKDDKIKVNWVTSGNEGDKQKIDYFSQGYMHDLATNSEKLNEVVRYVLRNTENGEKILTFESTTESNKTSIISDTASLFALNNEINQKETSIKENGSSNAVQAEIQKIKQQIATLSGNEEEIEKLLSSYSQLLDTLNKTQAKIDIAKNIEAVLLQLQNKESIISSDVSSVITTISNEDDEFDIKKDFQAFEQKVNVEFLSFLKSKISSVTDFCRNKVSEQESIKIKDEFKKGEEYKKQSAIFDDLNTKLSIENVKLSQVLNLEKERDLKLKQQEGLLNRIIQTYFSTIEQGDYLCKNLNCEASELKIEAVYRLKEKELSTFYDEHFNSRSQNNMKSSDFIDRIKSDNTKEFIKTFIQNLLKDKYTLKGSSTSLGVATNFLSHNWFRIDYNLIYQNDSFEEMSPGKQAFVVLKLLLDFNKSKCPILIDQPEDSLDNRAIYNELVTYIKNKKTERQIILVTHNANIVVGGDAELVIVANQNGKDSPNKNGIKFQYLTGALENSIKKHGDAKTPVLDRQGIREHVCEILEGGQDAFDVREKKYGFMVK